MTDVVENKQDKCDVEVNADASTPVIINVDIGVSLELKVKPNGVSPDIHWSGKELLDAGLKEVEVYGDRSVFARRHRKVFLGYLPE